MLIYSHHGVLEPSRGTATFKVVPNAAAREKTNEHKTWVTKYAYSAKEMNH